MKLRLIGRKRQLSGVPVAALLISLIIGVAALAPVEARLAPPGNQNDRTAVVNEAWFAMTGQPYVCGGKYYKGYLVSDFNYMGSDTSAQKEMTKRFGDNAGWTTQKVADGYYQKIGRGGQCLFFVNLILFRSGADTRYHTNWSILEGSAAPIGNTKAGDVIFTLKKWGKASYNHAAIVVYRNGNTVGLIESNWVDANPTATPPKDGASGGEIISYRTTTISNLKNAGYKIYTGVDYYKC